MCSDTADITAGCHLCVREAERCVGSRMENSERCLGVTCSSEQARKIEAEDVMLKRRARGVLCFIGVAER